MIRATTISACGKPKYLWQRAQIEGIGDPLQDNKNLKPATLRMNPFTDKAYMKDVTIGSFNCGDGSEEGKIWFRIVDTPTVESVNQQVFVQDEMLFLARNQCERLEARPDGHCYRRSIASILFGLGSDTPDILRQVLHVLAAGLEMYSDELDTMAFKFAGEEDFSFKNYCYERAKLFRRIDCSQRCSKQEWGGGLYGCDNFVLAKILNGRVILTNENMPTLYVYNSNFEASAESVSTFSLEPGDIPLSHVWGYQHFEPYIRKRIFFYNSFIPPFFPLVLILPNSYSLSCHFSKSVSERSYKRNGRSI